MQRVRDFGALALDRKDVFTKVHSSRLRIQCRRGDRKLVRARDGGGLQGNSISQTQATDTVAVYIRPAQVQARPNLSVEKEK